MKIILLWPLILFNLLTACSQPKELNEADINLINELGFNQELISEIRKLTDSTFLKRIENEELIWIFKDSVNYVEFTKKGLVGLQVNESQNKAKMIVNRLREKFNENGYYIYISEFNFGYTPDEITVLKTNDKFDLLRFEGTNGINYDIYVEDIIDKLSDWDKKYGMKMIGVGFDFLEADYDKLPDNLNEYAEELYTFCPDIVDQGVGTMDALIMEIKSTKKLYLWWD